MRMHMRPALLALTASLALATAAAAVELDPKLGEYRPVSGVSGNLKSIGSDTLNNLMTLWAEGFKAQYPNVKIEIEGKGSSTAPPALDRRHGAVRADVTPDEAARRWTSSRRSSATSRRPSRVAVDALAVFVHKDNPIAVPDPAAGRRDLLEDPQGRARPGRRNLGRPRPHRRVGGQAHLALRPQLGFGHLRLLQGGRAVQGRLQGQREGAAGLLRRGAGRRHRQVRDRLLGHRLQDRGRAGRAARQEAGSSASRPRPSTPTRASTRSPASSTST